LGEKNSGILAKRSMNNFMRIDPEYPDSWGSYFWIAAHTVAAGYPKEPTEDDRTRYRVYFDSFEFVLPCIDCRESWSILLQKRPLTDAAFATRRSLCRWLLDVHNLVNEKLGKKLFDWKQLTMRYHGIEETLARLRTVPRISLRPESVSGSSLIPDTSLGRVGHKTPSAWRNTMVNTSKPPIRTVRAVTRAYGTAEQPPRRRKCGCKK
jgi:hypothetical protein